ncbi:thiol reductant ABC exporter subunit CydD [Halomonas sp. WWR20]
MSSPPTPRQWLSANAKRGGVWARVAVIAGTASTLLLFVQAWSIATVAQRMVIDDAAFSSVIVPLAVLPLAFIGRGALAWLKTEAGTRSAILIRQSIRRDLLIRLGELGPLWARRQHSATLGNRVWDQVDALQGYYADYRPQMLLCVSIPLLIWLAVLPLNWAVAIILLVTAPIIPLNMAMVGMGAKQRQEAQFREMSRMSRHFLDTLRGLPTLKLFGVSRAQAEVIHEVSENFRISTMRVLRLAFLSSTVLEFFSSVAIAVLAIYIGFVYLGYYDFGTWGHGLDLFIGLFVLILAPDFYQPLRDLGTHYHAKAEAEAAAEDLIAVLERDASDRPGRRDWQVPERLGLKLHSVTCRYADRQVAALERLSLDIRAGETLAVIGPSGAGKTTLLNLLMGFLPPESGTLETDDGTRLDTLAPECWQRALGWVGQQPTLLSGTLADNLRLAAPEAGEAALWYALEQADLGEWARQLPEGLATRLGEGGQPVSGGQKRRIALARVFLREAPLILLDEPTASLDRDSETRVMRALERLKPGRTLVMLTHRLELLQFADRVLILRNGHVQALDTLEALCAPGGPLAESVTSVELPHE